MTTKHTPQNDQFKRIILKDNPEIETDPAIEQRLSYYFNLQHSKQKVYSNSFVGFFSWIFSKESLVLKTGFICIVAGFLFLKSPISFQSSVLSIDSCGVNKIYVDSNTVVKDTCFN